MKRVYSTFFYVTSADIMLRFVLHKIENFDYMILNLRRVYVADNEPFLAFMM
jgi:hypothetical protein